MRGDNKESAAWTGDEVGDSSGTDALNFFRPLRGGVTTQQASDGIIVQQRPLLDRLPAHHP